MTKLNAGHNGIDSTLDRVDDGGLAFWDKVRAIWEAQARKNAHPASMQTFYRAYMWDTSKTAPDGNTTRRAQAWAYWTVLKWFC